MQKLRKSSAYKLSIVVIFAILFAAIIIFISTQASNNSFPATKSDNQKEGFSFAAAGDFSFSDEAELVLEAIGKSQADFTIALGDLGYGGSGMEDKWCKFVKQRVGKNYPFELIVGNHENGVGNASEFSKYKKCLPNRIKDVTGTYGVQYYFDYDGLARFIQVAPSIKNYGSPYLKGDKGYQWLQRAIDDARKENIPWIVLNMHKNCVTIGDKSCEIGEDIMDLALSKKVDVVLQGHEHFYARSKQLSHSEDCPELKATGPANKVCIARAGDEFQQGDGTVLMISGAGGRELRKIETDDPQIGYFESWNGEDSGDTHGFALFDVTKDALRMRFVGVGEGNFQDTMTIRTE